MAGAFHHEQLYRGRDAVVRLGEARLTLCGAGALGSHLAENLVRQGIQSLRVVDRDRVEDHNVGTQVYGEADVGARKADVLRARLFRSTGVEIEALAKELTGRTARALLPDSGLVLDTFDNSVSRRLVQEHCRGRGVQCLHVGLAGGYAEVVWDGDYRVPDDTGLDACDYPLARNLVLLAVAVASEVVVRFLLDGERQNWSVTLVDFAVRPLERRM
jgi:molybdopterin/thiamine biosynthesis adenylyltransferase